MKKLCILFVCTVFVLLFAVCAWAAALGDVDVNGAVDAADARLALRTAVGLEPAVLPGTEAFAAADADFSGTVTSEDARSILRAAVGLEDLADRLPESAALTEESIAEKLRLCIVDFFVDYEEASGNTGVGVAIDENGTVLVPYNLIHKATAITAERDGCCVEAVLWADPASNLALLKVSGDIPYLPVNRTWFNIGDTVYSTDYSRTPHRMTITTPPTDSYPEIPENAICAQLTTWEYSFDLNYYPLADRFGRVIGFIFEDEEINGKRIAVAAPLSLLPPPEAYEPRSVEDFSREECRVSLEAFTDEISLVQYGVGLVPLYARNRTWEPCEIVNPRKDLLDVSVSFDEAEFPILVFLAKAPCENVPVTFRVKGYYETFELTLPVSVTTDGYVNMVGMPFLPDPGVVWETLPKDLIVSEAISLTYLKFNTGLTDEELFYSYTDYLHEMGFEYVRTEEYDDSYRYVFRLEEYDATVEYTDSNATVTVACYFGK